MPKNTSGLKRGGPGRPRGTLNRVTVEVPQVPNFVFVNPDGKGTIFRKSGSRVGKVRPQPAVVSRTLHDTDVRRYGDTAILTGILTTKVQSGREDNQATTVVWVRENGRWLIASAQVSEVIR